MCGRLEKNSHGLYKNRLTCGRCVCCSAGAILVILMGKYISSGICFGNQCHSICTQAKVNANVSLFSVCDKWHTPFAVELLLCSMLSH